MKIRSGSFVIALWLAFPLITIAEESPDFNAKVLPVFRKYCNTCHNATDAEAGLILLDHVRTMKGSEDGPVVVAGKSDQSRLWQRLIATDDSKMPPKDQPVPSPKEMAVVKAWIDAGAKAPAAGMVATALVTPKISPKANVRNAVTSIAASPDGRFVAVAKPHSVEIQGANGSVALSGHTGTINEVSFSRDGQWLIVAAGEIGLVGEATLWKTAYWSRGPIIQGHADGIYSAQLSPDGMLLATASYDRDVKTWNISTGKEERLFRGHNDAVYGLAFSPNGKHLATASGDRTVKLWDVATGQRLDTFSQPSKEQNTVVFSPDGRYVAAGGVDCRVRIWQISETGREGTNPIQYARFAHEGPILRLAFSPDGKLLASSSEDRRIKIWETDTFTQVAVTDKQPDWPSALAFTADNRQLLVGKMNGEVQRIEVEPKWYRAITDLQFLRESTERSDQAAAVAPAPVSEAEPNDAVGTAMALSIPAIVQGELKAIAGLATDTDIYRVTVRQGEQLVIETEAARTGSLADTKLDVLDAEGRPVLRTLLQAVRDSWINFRPIDSIANDVRLEFWEEMDLNQYLYFNGEVCKTFRAPQGPDSGYQLYAIGGKRKNYFDTSAAVHAKDEPVYIVEAYSPKSKIIENGLPVFPVYFSNDDEADRKLGRDSRILFTAPEDGTYLIRVADVRGFSGENFQYKLHVRQPNPDFAVTVTTMNPKVPAGSGQRLRFSLDRIDGYDGPVRLELTGIPSGFQASSPVVFQAGLVDATSVLTASPDAAEPTKEDSERVSVVATAEIGGRMVTKTFGGIGEIKLEKPAAIRVKLIPDDPSATSTDQGLVIEPGTTITAKIVVERNGHEDDVRLDVDNLPHGIIVDNIGLSGVLVRKNETERQIFLTARPWVPETDRLIHAVSQQVGSQASPAIPLHVRKKPAVAAR